MEFSGEIADLGSNFTDSESSGSDSADSGTGGSAGSNGSAGNRRRGRPSKSGTIAGNSSERFTDNGNDRATVEKSENGNDKTEHIKTDSFRVDDSKKPNDKGFKIPAITATSKYKKGYKPLLNQKESIEAVDNIFGLVAVTVDSRWALEVEESKELGERVGKLLALFPVKLENNAEILEKAMAILAVLIGLWVICNDRLSESLKGENDGIIGKFFKKETNGTNAGNAKN